MHAPSPQLLRAMRSLISTTHSKPHSQLLRPRSQRIPHNPSTNSPSSPRTLSTTNSHTAPPRPPPSTTNAYAPRHHDRGPPSTEETQTDFSAMDIFNTAQVSTPATSIDACTPTGFHLNNGIKTSTGAGLALLGGEAFTWSPWGGGGAASSTSQSHQGLLSANGMLELSTQSLGVLRIMYPKPDLLILGTGAKLWMVGKETKRYLMAELGVRVDVMDTANASAAYNLLALERGVEGGGGVGALLLPLGWKGR